MYLRRRGEGQTQIDKIEKRSLSCSLCDILRSSEGVRSKKKKNKKINRKSWLSEIIAAKDSKPQRDFCSDF